MQAAACAECAAAKDHLRPIKIEIQKAYVIACGITGSVKPIPVFIIADDGDHSRTELAILHSNLTLVTLNMDCMQYDRSSMLI